MNSRSSVWAACSGATLAVVALAGSAWAQETRFDPSVALRYAYTSNVRFVEADAIGNVEESDTSLGLVVSLPLRRSWRDSDLLFRYDLSGQRYSDNADFDDVAHRLRLDYTRSTRRGNRWRVYTQAVQTQEQGLVPGLPAEIRPGDPPAPAGDPVSQIVTDRVDRRTLSVGGNYGLRIGSRWELDFGAGALDTTFDGVSGVGPSAPSATVEERQQYYGSVTLGRQASRRSRFSIRYQYGEVDFESSNDETFQNADLQWLYNVTRRLIVDLRLGAFRRSVKDSDESETGATGAVSVKFNDGLVAGPIRIDFDVGASPSGGDYLVGTALNTYAGVTFSGVRTRPWNWRIPLRYQHRSPFESQLEATDTASIAAIVERTAARALGVRFGARYVDQSSDDEALEASFYRADVSLVWYFLSGRRISGRG